MSHDSVFFIFSFPRGNEAYAEHRVLHNAHAQRRRTPAATIVHDSSPDAALHRLALSSFQLVNFNFWRKLLQRSSGFECVASRILPLLLRLQHHLVDYLWKPVATPLFVHNEPSSGSFPLLVFWEIRRAAKPIDVAFPCASTSLRDSLLCSCSSLRCDRWRMKSGRRNGSHLAPARHASNLRIHPGAHEML